jgi:uncharacterized protein YebE (UPF0316 family)
MGVEFILIIIGINVLYVSFFTLRMLMVFKGYRVLASILAMVEVFVYLKGRLLYRLGNGRIHRQQNRGVSGYGVCNVAGRGGFP